MNIEQYEKSKYGKGLVEEAFRYAESIRSDRQNPRDISFAEVIQEKFNVSMDSFFNDLGIDPNYDTVQNIVTLPDLNVRWIIPEIFREALRLGYRKAPIWPNIIISEEQISQLSAVMPKINMSDAAPRRVSEGETIPLGEISYGSKVFKIYKIGRGIKISDEVRQFASLNVVSIFLQDFGVKFGQAMDTLAINTLINGEQADGSESCPVIGTTTGVPATKAYNDFLRIWIRMARLGRNPNTIIAGEDSAIATLGLTEFKTPYLGQPIANIDLKTPIPAKSNYFIHSGVPANQELILDPTVSIIKFNAIPLKVESERIVSNQTNAFYASLTTGFAKAFRDGSLIVDSSKAFGSFGYPAWMDASAAQLVNIQ
jgi:hypothetical protein